MISDEVPYLSARVQRVPLVSAPVSVAVVVAAAAVVVGAAADVVVAAALPVAVALAKAALSPARQLPAQSFSP